MIEETLTEYEEPGVAYVAPPATPEDLSKAISSALENGCHTLHLRTTTDAAIQYEKLGFTVLPSEEKTATIVMMRKIAPHPNQIAVEEVFARLEIPHEIIEHPPMFTVADGEKYNVDLKGADCKNLFLRNKNKSIYYMVCLPSEKRADLKAIAAALDESKLSFGSSEALMQKLCIKSGTVSVLNIVGAPDTDVVFILDRALWDKDRVSFHPNTNTASVLFPPDGLELILKEYNTCYKIVRF